MINNLLTIEVESEFLGRKRTVILDAERHADSCTLSIDNYGDGGDIELDLEQVEQLVNFLGAWIALKKTQQELDNYEQRAF